MKIRILFLITMFSIFTTLDYSHARIRSIEKQTTEKQTNKHVPQIEIDDTTQAIVDAKNDASFESHAEIWGCGSAVTSCIVGIFGGHAIVIGVLSDYLDAHEAEIGWTGPTILTASSVGCLAGSVILMGSQVAQPSPSAKHLIGKSPEYVASYSETYIREIKRIRRTTISVSCIAGSILSGILLNSMYQSIF